MQRQHLCWLVGVINVCDQWVWSLDVVSRIWIYLIS